MGGRNIGDHYFAPGQWSDFSARVRGPVVGELARNTLKLLGDCLPHLHGLEPLAKQRKEYHELLDTLGEQIDTHDKETCGAVAAGTEPVGPLSISWRGIPIVTAGRIPER